MPLELERTAGFTLIEALVALSIVAVALTSIGTLIASTARAAHSIDTRLTRLETARAIMTALPARNQLVAGTLTGAIADHPWRVEVFPFAVQDITRSSGGQWVPQSVAVTIQAPGGAAMKVITVRLMRGNSK